jgi:hypothetical protein
MNSFYKTSLNQYISCECLSVKPLEKDEANIAIYYICIHTHIYLNISSGTVVAYEDKEGQDSRQDVSFILLTVVSGP